MKRLLVIGAGPVGLAAALRASRRGLDVTVVERDDVGASLLRWGSTRFFSPAAWNVAPWARGLVDVDPDAILTGPEFVRAVLRPLAAQVRVLPGHRVVALGRAGLRRTELAGHPVRAERRFRAVVATPEGERVLEAEAVLDASGTYGNPNGFGAGGLPAPGLAGVQAIRDLGALEDQLPALAGRRVLLVGHGHSAANALGVLARVADEDPATRVVWATTSLNRRPCVEVAGDPLPERQRVVAAANDLAAKPPGWLRVERRAALQSATGAPSDRGGNFDLGGRSVEADVVVALTGYRPDLSFLGELALEIAPATEGAGRLSAALANVTDCLCVPAVAPRDLASGEPGFHLIGHKSYGRSSTFLLQTGYDQVATIVDGL